MEMNQNMINSARMMESSRLATTETFKPDELENLPPNMEEDEEVEEVLNTTTPQQGGYKGGSLLETLLKVSADTAHAVVLAGSAIEINKRLKKRRQTRRRSSKKKLTRKR